MEVVQASTGGGGSGKFWRDLGNQIRSFYKMASTTTSNNRTHVIEVSYILMFSNCLI